MAPLLNFSRFFSLQSFWAYLRLAFVYNFFVPFMFKNFTKSIFFFLALWLSSAFSTAQAQVYFSENFNGNTIPTGWTVVDQGVGACRWMIHAPYDNNGTMITMLGSNFLFVNSDSAGFGTEANETITTPVINANPGGNLVFLEFSHYFRNLFSDSDTGFVQVFNGSNWVNIKTITTEIGTGENPVTEKLNVTAHINPNFRIRFRYVGDYAWYWAIDNVRLFSPSPNDVGVIKINSGQSNCGSLPNPFTVSVLVVNFSSAPLSNIPISYRVNGGALVSQTISTSIPADDTLLVNFSTPFVPTGNQNYTFQAFTGLSGDIISDNDTSSLFFKALPTGLAVQDFAGYNGSNLNIILPDWQEANGLNPVTGFSGWINSSPEQIAHLGTTAAKINLYSNFRKEWLITQPFLPKPGSFIKFDLAMTNFNGTGPSEWGSDDSLIVRISTDCGQTWADIKSFTAADPISNNLEKQSISLGNYGNQNILIGFYATDGSEDDMPDFDLHLTNLELLVPSGNDLFVSRILGYDPICLATDPFTVKVRVVNNGTLVQNSIPLSYSLNGQTPVSQTFTQALNPGQSAELTFSQTVALPLTTNNLLKVWSSLALDSNNINDTIKNFRLDKPGTSLSQVNFNGYNGDNISSLFPGWREASGLIPTGTFSGWNSSNLDQTSFFGTTTAKANLYSNFAKNWMISPPFIPQGGEVLKFKIALTDFGVTDSTQMGSDDSLAIRYSSDCGQTWNQLALFTASDNLSNNLVEKTVYLTGLGGQKIQLAFYATDGETADNTDIDVHIDDIQLAIPPNKDLGVSHFVLPAASCGLPNTLPIVVKITNFGGQAQSNFPVSYRFNNSNIVTENFTGNLAPGAEADFTFSGSLDLTNLSSNLIKVWTGLAGDVNQSNDTLIQTLAIPPLSLPILDFTGYVGNNIGTLYPGWREFSTGSLPSASNSAWVNLSNFQQAPLGGPAARVSMFSNLKREWMAGPVFRALPNSVIKFSAAVVNRGGTTADAMGADDSVNVMVSTNCGISWSRVFSITAANNLPPTLTPFEVSLSAYDGQRIMIAFFATEGNVTNPQDYDFVMDKVDVGISTSISGSEMLSKDLIVYPNPSQGLIQIRMPETQNAANPVFEVINMQGRKLGLNAQKLEKGEWRIDLSNQPKGVYKLRIQTGKESVLRSVIIK
jgi:hypothetical protein